MRATFRVAKMDCSAEEQLVRMKLDGLAAAVQIDLDQRTVTVSHDGDIAEIKTALDSLNFETTQLDTVAGTAEPESAEANERSVLTIALLINAGFFCCRARRRSGRPIYGAGRRLVGHAG
jgi:copper chaperone CopZ